MRGCELHVKTTLVDLSTTKAEYMATTKVYKESCLDSKVTGGARSQARENCFVL